jgi:phosphoglycerate kinase
MSKFKSILSENIKNKTVLLRVDLNVPMKNGTVADDTRLQAILPTLNYLVQNKAKVVLISHFGRPEGVFNQSMSLQPVVKYLAKLVDFDVKFTPDCQGEIVKKAIQSTRFGEAVVLENLRFYKQETKGDIDFAKNLASFADVYVNDTFSSSHRAHASITTIAEFLPSFAGLLMQSELENLCNLLENPQQPLMAIVGGAKVSTKIDLLNNLSKTAKIIVIGGGMANTFLYANGCNVGKSLCEKDLADTALKIIETAKNNGCEIILPNDVVVAKQFVANSLSANIDINNIQDDDLILDIGKNTIEQIANKINLCKTVVWNGPLGAFEIEPFHIGTQLVAKIVANKTANKQLLSVAGGGDIVAALNSAKLAEDFTYISTAGGAFLEWLEGKILPGVKVLQK